MEPHIITNGDNFIIGVSHLSKSEQYANMHHIAQGTPLPWDNGSFRGWKYIGGEFIPPTEAYVLNKELKSVTAELHKIFENEQFDVFLGEAPVMTMSIMPTRKEELMARRSEIKKRLAEIG